MQEHEEEWRDLCAKAAVEQDSDKLAELVKEINRLLKLKEERLNASRRTDAKPVAGG